MENKIPGSSAWKRVKFERDQIKNPTILDGTSDTYQIDCLETMTRYIVSKNKVVSQISADDIEWLSTFTPALKPFGELI